MYNLPERTQENMETKIDPLTMENIVKINLSKSTGPQVVLHLNSFISLRKI